MDEAAADERRSGVTFSKQISLGDGLKALSMIILAVIFIVGIRFGAQQEMTELRGQMDRYQDRMKALTDDFGEFKRSAAQQNTELRQKIDAVATAIADMRVAIAQRSGSK